MSKYILNILNEATYFINAHSCLIKNVSLYHKNKKVSLPFPLLHMEAYTLAFLDFASLFHLSVH